MSELGDIVANNPVLKVIHEEEEEPETLWEAISESDIKKVKELAKDETQINSFCEDCNYKTPLTVAVEIGDYEIVKILLDNRADPYFGVEQDAHVDYSKFPLTIAENNRQNNRAYDARINLALLEVCKNNPAELANEICWNLGKQNHRWDFHEFVRCNIANADVDINMQDKNGNTPLLAILTQHHLIRGYNHAMEAVKLLLEHGANPNAKNNNGMTPLSLDLSMHLAYFDNLYEGYIGHTPIIEMLLDHGADFGYALYSNVECGKYILDKMKANVPKDNLQGIIDLLFGKYNSTTDSSVGLEIQ